jgi:hypothetical protein
MISGADVKRMDEQAQAVQAAMRNALAWVTKKKEGLFSSVLLSAQEESLIANIRTNERRAQRWLTVERLWAEAGKEPDGRTYPVDFYLKAGRIITDTFNAAIGETKHQAVLSLTVTQTQKDVERKVQQVKEKAEQVASRVNEALRFIGSPKGIALVGFTAAAIIGAAWWSDKENVVITKG